MRAPNLGCKMLLLTLQLVCFLGVFWPVHSAANVGGNIQAIIVASSRYWFNYRHAMNALGIYKILKDNGVSDEDIVLMIADEYAVNPRNPFKNGLYATGVSADASWYSPTTEIDFRGSDVTVESFINSVLGKGPKSLPATNGDSNLLIFVTGHGGDQFFKFQDEEELTAQDIANLSEELTRQKKYRKVLWIADTCQAFTLFDMIDQSLNQTVYTLGTSLRDQNAYAHHSDRDLGLSVIERWTHGFMHQYGKKNFHPSNTNLYQLMVKPFANKDVLGANIGTTGDFNQLRLAEFFGSPSRSTAKKGGTKKRDLSIKRIPRQILSPARPSEDSPALLVVPSQEIPSTSQRLNEKELMLEPAFEPTDSVFMYLLCGLLVLVCVTSSFGRYQPTQKSPELR